MKKKVYRERRMSEIELPSISKKVKINAVKKPKSYKKKSDK